MKYIILITILLASLSSNSQKWAEVSLPFDYLPVFNINSINKDIYISKYDEKLGKSGGYANYRYLNNELIRADNDTIFELFGKPYHIQQNGNRLLVSCRNGIYYSKDSAKNWKELPSKIGPNLKDIAISNNGIFVISNAFGNLSYKYDTLNNIWTQLYENKNDTTKKFLAHQIESNNSYTFAVQKKIVSPWSSTDTLRGGLFISGNGGDTWELKLADSSLVELFVSASSLIVSTINGNILKSTNSGNSWNVINVNKVLYNFNMDNERIIAGTTPDGIVQSYNGGNSWEKISNRAIYSKIYKEDSNYYFIGKGNLLFQADSLFSDIKRINYTYPNATIHTIYNIDDTLFATGEFARGIQYSTDLSLNWNTYYSELEQQQIKIQEFYKNQNDIFLKSGFSYYYSSDYGVTFENKSIFGFYDNLLALEDRIFLYGKSGVMISKNNGKNFTLMDTAVIKNQFRLTKIAKTQNDELIAFSISNGIFKSKDKGEHWSLLVDSIPNGTNYNSIYSFYEFDNIYYAVNDLPMKLLKSDDQGNTWSEIKIGLFDEISNFYLYMLNKDIIIISSYGYSTNGIKLTLDGGVTWSDIEGNLPKGDEEIQPYKILGVFKDNLIISRFSNGLRGSKLFRTKLVNLGISTSSVNNKIERNYLYTYPPYPNPAEAEINILTYWDINLPMKESDIMVYDLDGIEVNTDDKIKLVKQADHYGKVIWDCSGETTGVYFINIKHGSESKVVKVLVQ